MINLSGHRVKILCEDNSHFYFLQGVFEALSANVSDRDKSFKKMPNGEGCGAQTVLTGFKDLADAAVRNNNRENIVYAAIIDGDGDSFEHKKQELYSSIIRGVKQRIEAMDKFFIAIPRKNIETWLMFCSGAQNGADVLLNEETDYKHSGMRIKPKQAGRWLIGKLRKGTLNCRALDSLAKFCEQFIR